MTYTQNFTWPRAKDGVCILRLPEIPEDPRSMRTWCQMQQGGRLVAQLTQLPRSRTSSLHQEEGKGQETGSQVIQAFLEKDHAMTYS